MVKEEKFLCHFLRLQTSKERQLHIAYFAYKVKFQRIKHLTYFHRSARLITPHHHHLTVNALHLVLYFHCPGLFTTKKIIDVTSDK